MNLSRQTVAYSSKSHNRLHLIQKSTEYGHQSQLSQRSFKNSIPDGKISLRVEQILKEIDNHEDGNYQDQEEDDDPQRYYEDDDFENYDEEIEDEADDIVDEKSE